MLSTLIGGIAGEVMDGDEEVPSGYAVLSAERDGYATKQVSATITPKTSTISLALDPLPARREPTVARRDAGPTLGNEQEGALVGHATGGTSGIGSVGMGTSGTLGALGIGTGGGGFGELHGRGERRTGRGVIAVFDLEDMSGSFSKSSLGQSVDYLAAKLASSGYRVIPRAEVRAALAKEKKRSFAACYDERCQIELGRAVAATKSLSSKLLEQGKACTLAMIVYDLKTETSERAATVELPCTSEGLHTAIDRAVRQL